MKSEKLVIRTLLRWHKVNRRSFPWRDEQDPYKILLAEYFLQRTPAERVSKIFPDFVLKYPNIRILSEANLNDLEKEYKSLGLQKRMKWIIDSMKIIDEIYCGKVPDTKNELMRLPGVGEYTASAILCFAYHKPVAIVDVNVKRILTRLYNVDKKDISILAKKMIPSIHYVAYNESLLDFSAKICKKNPLCQECVLNKLCHYYNKTRLLHAMP